MWGEKFVFMYRYVFDHTHRVLSFCTGTFSIFFSLDASNRRRTVTNNSSLTLCSCFYFDTFLRQFYLVKYRRELFHFVPSTKRKKTRTCSLMVWPFVLTVRTAMGMFLSVFYIGTKILWLCNFLSVDGSTVAMLWKTYKRCEFLATAHHKERTKEIAVCHRWLRMTMEWQQSPTTLIPRHSSDHSLYSTVTLMEKKVLFQRLRLHQFSPLCSQPVA